MNMGRGQGVEPPAGGPARHIPVLLHEAMNALDLSTGGLFLDGTFGAGGYTRAILAAPNTRVLALDRDPSAIRGGYDLVQESDGRLTLSQARFGALADAAAQAGLDAFDGIVFDIGVSSMQFDEADRGFSFRFDGPLDMRMESDGQSAADIVNEADAEMLANILYYYGDERASRRIARFILAARAEAPILTTGRLAEIVARAIPGKPNEIHPATRTFQALRIATNNELGELVSALVAAESMLKIGGRLVVVTFHSLEDRIVKQFFAARAGRGGARSRLLPGEPIPAIPTFDISGKQPVAPSHSEVSANPRARSAKLRWAIRNDTPARGSDRKLDALAALPEPSGRQSR